LPVSGALFLVSDVDSPAADKTNMTQPNLHLVLLLSFTVIRQKWRLISMIDMLFIKKLSLIIVTRRQGHWYPNYSPPTVWCQLSQFCWAGIKTWKQWLHCW